MSENPQMDALIKAASQLITKMDAITASDEYKAVWTLAYAHGMPYKGENCKDELEALRIALLTITGTEK